MCFSECRDAVNVRIALPWGNSITEETKVCKGLRVNDTVIFYATIELIACPKYPIRQFSINPIGLTEKLDIELEFLCQCDCEKDDQREINSMKCSGGNGTYECGICNCNTGRFGPTCNCDLESGAISNEENDAKCKRDNSTSKVCSGRGQCNCGECYCENSNGKFCQCDGSCDYGLDNKVCSGKGQCICDGEVSRCKCDPGFEGHACDCNKSKKPCTAPGSNVPCNGKGICDCGKCFCEPGHVGQHCQDCLDCENKCKDYEHCVRCKAFHEGNFTTKQCEEECTYVTIEDGEISNQGKMERLCIITHDDNCRSKYVYNFDPDNKNKSVTVQKRKEGCPVSVLPIVLGTVGGIVAVGLCLLLIWKLLTTIHDRKEFARFENDRLQAKWNKEENPLYVQATTNFQNPTYSGH